MDAFSTWKAALVEYLKTALPQFDITADFSPAYRALPLARCLVAVGLEGASVSGTQAEATLRFDLFCPAAYAPGCGGAFDALRDALAAKPGFWMKSCSCGRMAFDALLDVPTATAYVSLRGFLAPDESGAV